MDCSCNMVPALPFYFYLKILKIRRQKFSILILFKCLLLWHGDMCDVMTNTWHATPDTGAGPPVTWRSPVSLCQSSSQLSALSSLSQRSVKQHASKYVIMCEGSVPAWPSDQGLSLPSWQSGPGQCHTLSRHSVSLETLWHWSRDNDSCPGGPGSHELSRGNISHSQGKWKLGCSFVQRKS